MKVTVDVKNTGEMIGKEAVMLFSSDLVAALTPDVRRLRAFQKIELKPGESKTVTLNLLADDLAYVNELGKWFLEKGDFKLQVGNQITKITCTESKLWEKPNK